MISISHEIAVNTPQDQLFRALSTLEGLKGWYTRRSKEPPTGMGKRFLALPTSSRSTGNSSKSSPTHWFSGNAHEGLAQQLVLRLHFGSPARVATELLWSAITRVGRRDTRLSKPATPFGES